MPAQSKVRSSQVCPADKGFTLIELMIVVVVLAVLVSIAVPSYQRYVDRARRSDAADLLMQLAAQQERNYSNNASYAITASLGYTVNASGWVNNAAGTYQFQVAAAISTCPLATCYEVFAEPIGTQLRDEWQLSLKSTGQRQSRKGSIGAWTAGWPER